MIKDTPIELCFPVVHQYWMDSGLLGFYSLAKSALKNYPSVSLSASEDGVLLKGTESDLDDFLHHVYQVLLDEYYNTSSPKQIEANAGFYYDSVNDTFVRFPKVKSMGIAGIVFSKAPRPTADSVPYVKGSKGLLPEKYAYLQERFDQFLTENNLKADGATFLIDGKNAYQPRVTIAVSPKKAKRICFLCGSATSSSTEISSTVFPLITGSSGIRSFNSGCDKSVSICWMCDYISKFVPVTGYYSMNGSDIFVFLPYSHSFKKMMEVMPSFESAKKYDSNRFRNFEEKLGFYFQKPYEQFLSFMYTVYQRTCTLGGTDADDEGEMDFGEMLNITISDAPVSYYLLQFQELGKTFAGKLVWNFTEAVYLFRLFSLLHKENIVLQKVMQTLIESEQSKNKSKTIVRNKICERILKKQHTTDLIESYVYHINRSEKRFIKPVADFVEMYEKLLYDGNTMKQDLINTAVSLGKTIGLTLGEQGKKGRSDLFVLRKARKSDDFLNEIVRMQLKYNVSVTRELYEKGELLDENFNEFKQFCMIAALNSFNAKTSDKFTKET